MKMHIPDSMLNGAICPVTSIVSTIGVAAATLGAMKTKDKPKASYFASITAFVFAAQMINFPIQNGTSGHLLGGVFAVAMLGIPYGVLAMALVLGIQCLFFSDGGVTVLGANIFNMAILGAGLGGFIYHYFSGRMQGDTQKKIWILGLSAWFSVLIAALVCSFELSFSGTVPFSKVIFPMLSVHALIGIGEGMITVAAYKLFSRSNQDISEGSAVVPLVAALLIGLLLSPFASGFPDGLEWVAEKYAFFHESAPAFVGPMPDYAIPLISNEMISTGVAGLLGVLISFLLAWGIFRVLPNLNRKEMGL